MTKSNTNSDVKPVRQENHQHTLLLVQILISSWFSRTSKSLKSARGDDNIGCLWHETPLLIQDANCSLSCSHGSGTERRYFLLQYWRDYQVGVDFRSVLDGMGSLSNFQLFESDRG